MSGDDALHHVGFTVGDLDRSVAFYSLLLGAEPFLHRVYDEPFIAEMIGYDGAVLGCAMFRIPRSGVTLELIQYHVPPGQGADMETYRLGNAHLCLVVDDLDAEYRRAPREPCRLPLATGRRPGRRRRPGGRREGALPPRP